jgi:eukaryotic-like serine/threonine-protein kinase
MRHALLVLCLALPSIPLDAAEPTPAAADVAGAWSGAAVHAGESQPFGISFEAGEGDALAAKMSVPALGLWEMPLPPARLEPGGVRIGSTFLLRYDRAAGTLSGPLPAALVPVYRIPLTLKRGALARPAEVAHSAPAAVPLWTFDAGAPVWGSAAVAGGLVYVGADDGRLMALDARSGTERWSFRAGGAIRARPLVAGGAVFVPSEDGLLYRLDARSGAVRWKVPVEGVPVVRIPIGQPNSRFERNASGAVLVDGSLYLGTHDGHLLALDPGDGARRWAFKAGDTVLSTPAVHGGRVYFGSFDGHVYALDAATGALAWKHDTKGPVVSTPAVHEGRVIVGSRSYDLLALDARTGAPLWTRYIWFSWVESSAVVRDGVAYVGSSDAARLFALDVKTGRSVWEVSTGGWPWGEPALAGGRVYIGSAGDAEYLVKHEGSFIAVDRAAGRMAWRFAVPPPAGKGQSGFVGSAAAADGRVFVGGLDGRVYAFAQ